MSDRGFESIVEEHKDRAFTYACYFLGNREDAEDVIQEMLLRLWRNFRSIPEHAIGRWILRVTRNLCIDAARQKKRAQVVTTTNDGGPLLETLLRDASENPLRALERTNLRDQIEAAIRELPEPIRSLIILREIQDLKYEDISHVMKIPLNSVKVYIHRGRRQLREKLRSLYRDEVS